MKKYSVVVVKEAALNPLTQQLTKRMEQVFVLYAESKQKAHREAHRLCTMVLEGTNSRTIIDGEEYVNE